MDLSFSVHKLAKFSSNPGKVHFESLVYLLRYIRENKTLGFKYYDDMNYVPVSDLLRQANIEPENQLMDFSDYIWQDCPETGISTGAYIIFYQGGTIDHGKHVLVPLAQPSAEIEYNAVCTAGTTLAYLRMLINEFLNKDTHVVPEEDPLIILDSKSAVCMTKNGKDIKNTRHIYRGVNFVMNGENCKMHKIDWCEGGLQLVEIVTKNIGEHDLTPRMKYIMVRLDN